MSKQSLSVLTADQLERINRHIASGAVTNAGDEKVTSTLTEGLITQNHQRIYRIDDNIPVMLENESIPADQFEGL